MKRLWCRFVGHEYGPRRKYLGKLKPGETVYCNDPRAVTLVTRHSVDIFEPQYTLVYESICERCDT